MTSNLDDLDKVAVQDDGFRGTAGSRDLRGATGRLAQVDRSAIDNGALRGPWSRTAS